MCCNYSYLYILQYVIISTDLGGCTPSVHTMKASVTNIGVGEVSESDVREGMRGKSK